MAAVESTRAASHGLTVGSRLNTLVASIAGSVRSWNDARLTRKALNRLSDRELADIGIARAEIGTIAAHMSA